MRRPVLPSLTALGLLVMPATVLANGWSRAVGEILFCIVVVPLIVMGIALACAIQASKSRFAIVYYPVIGGLVAAACVPALIRASFSAELFIRYGIVYGLAGLVIGGLAFLTRWVLHWTKNKPRGDSKERP